MVLARLALLAVLLAGCGHLAPTGGLPEATRSIAAGTPSGEPSPTPSPAPTRTSTPEAALPPGFPTYPGATAVAPDSGELAAWSSDDLPPSVYDHFLEALPAAGFRIDLEAPGGTAAIIRFTARDGTAYQLNFTGAGPVRIGLGPVRP